MCKGACVARYLKLVWYYYYYCCSLISLLLSLLISLSFMCYFFLFTFFVWFFFLLFFPSVLFKIYLFTYHLIPFRSFYILISEFFSLHIVSVTLTPHFSSLLSFLFSRPIHLLPFVLPLLHPYSLLPFFPSLLLHLSPHLSSLSAVVRPIHLCGTPGAPRDLRAAPYLPASLPPAAV